jgi:hypothetical protein
MKKGLAFAQCSTAARRKGGLALWLALCTLGVGLSATGHERKGTFIKIDSGRGARHIPPMPAGLAAPHCSLFRRYTISRSRVIAQSLETPDGKFRSVTP